MTGVKKKKRKKKGEATYTHFRFPTNSSYLFIIAHGYHFGSLAKISDSKMTGCLCNVVFRKRHCKIGPGIYSAYILHNVLVLLYEWVWHKMCKLGIYYQLTIINFFAILYNDPKEMVARKLV